MGQDEEELEEWVAYSTMNGEDEDQVRYSCSRNATPMLSVAFSFIESLRVYRKNYMTHPLKKYIARSTRSTLSFRRKRTCFQCVLYTGCILQITVTLGKSRNRVVCPKCSTRFREDYTRKITITRGSMMSGMQSPQKKVDVRRCISGHRNEGEEGGGFEELWPSDHQEQEKVRQFTHTPSLYLFFRHLPAERAQRTPFQTLLIH